MAANFYKTLGVSRTAGADEVRGAYRKLAMKYHPDRNPDDEAAANRFKEVSEAYAVLSDDEKKQQYDRFGKTAGSGGGSGFQRADFGDVFGDWMNQFDSVFGGSGRSGSRTVAVAGDDLEYGLEIDLEEAISGGPQEISFSAQSACSDCEGKGHEAGGGPITCGHCKGTGVMQSGQGIIFLRQSCRYCGGTGATFSKPCGSCRGRGLEQKLRTLSVNIPAGIDNGQMLRLSQQGGAGMHNGPAGDLYVRIKVRPHELFEREGDDLIVQVPLSFAQAALGDNVQITSPDGTILLKLPAGVQSGQVLRVRGRGVTTPGRRRKGDLLCRIQVQTPTSLSKAQRSALQEFDQSLPPDKHLNSLLDRIGNFFKRAYAGGDDES